MASDGFPAMTSWVHVVRRTAVVLLLSACSSPASSRVEDPPLAFLTDQGLALLDGGVLRPVPGTDDTETFCWDVDGAGFFVTTGEALEWVAVDGSRRLTILDGMGAVRFPDVSPDGRTVAVGVTAGSTSGGWSIWLVERDGSGRSRLASGYDPSWSADGRSLYFEQHEPSVALVTCDVESGRITPFLPSDQRDHTVECSVTGRYVAFSRDGALVLFDSADGSLRMLTDPATYTRFPSFSPDDRSLVCYRQQRSDDGGSRDLVLRIELATGRETMILEGRGTLAAYGP